MYLYLYILPKVYSTSAFWYKKYGNVIQFFFHFQIFLTLMSRTPPTEGGTISDGVKTYLLKIAKLTYLMCIQEPPMLLEWVRFGDILDPEKFKPYTSSGNSIVGTVWPVVLLHANGPVMSRGVVDMMISQSYR